MAYLDLFTTRKSHTVDLADGKTYQLPAEFTVEEAERILEIREEIEAKEKEKVEGDGAAQRAAHAALIFAQLEVMFRHHQPDMTAEYLRKQITHTEALDIIGFFRRHRHLAIKGLDDGAVVNTDSKKKSKLTAAKELRDLRRMVAFMVTCGFSLLDLRKLYIDELHEYYFELLYNLEESGKMKKGAYDKIRARTQGVSSAGDTVAQLRKQMLKSLSAMQQAK